MKTYTDTQRLSWVTANEPTIELNEAGSSQDAFYIRFWFESDWHVLSGSTQNEVIDKAMEFCRIKNLITDEYDDLFSITLNKGNDEKTFVFKLPYHIEEVSEIQDAYWAACKNTGVCLHEKRSHEGFLTLVVNDEINREAFYKLENKNVYVPNALFDNGEFINLLQSFMMTENESCYLIQVDVPAEIVEHLPSMNKTSYAPRNVVLGCRTA